MNKKNLIIEASQKLFARHGLKKVTTDDIAREASISKATIYKIYKNKTEIFRDVVDFESKQLFDKIRLAVNTEKTVEAKFRAHLITKLSTLKDLVILYNVTRETWNDYWPNIEDIRQKFIDEEIKIVKGILLIGVKNKELAPKNINEKAKIMVIALKSLEFLWILDGINVKLDSYVDIMIKMMLDGIRKK